MREVGGVTGKRDVGYKAAKCKEGHGYIFVYFDKWSNFWWSPVRLDHSAYDIYNDQQDPYAYFNLLQFQESKECINFFNLTKVQYRIKLKLKDEYFFF